MIDVINKLYITILKDVIYLSDYALLLPCQTILGMGMSSMP